MSTQATEAISLPQRSSKTVFPVLWAVSLCHLLNDMTQALLPAVYPILRGNPGSELRASRISDVCVSDAPRRCFSRSSVFTPTAGRCRIRCRSAWPRQWPACSRSLSRRATPRCLSARCCSGLVPRSSIRNPRASLALLPAARMASLNPCFKSAATSARPSALWPPPSSCCRAGRADWPGSRSRLSPASSSSRDSAIGISKTGTRSVNRTQRRPATPRSLAGTCQRRCRS